ncbi:MAG TPA: pyridoxamine 5'-phosphate oxidase family protein [Zeimonas sp.]|nr:pyridoxamine 5'-phosphate oxidase family protein [Zeimonas sp.]
MSTGEGEREARRLVQAFVAANHVLTLASTGPHGPWAAPVFYAERFEAACRPRLVFVSSPSSRHAREFAADARAAAAIHANANDWRAIRGVQLTGVVRALEDDELPAAREAYARKFPQIGGPDGAPEPIAHAFARVRWFAFVAERAVLTDNAVAFGWREEVRFAGV